jgi:hypothetical protein
LTVLIATITRTGAWLSTDSWADIGLAVIEGENQNLRTQIASLEGKEITDEPLV